MPWISRIGSRIVAKMRLNSPSRGRDNEMGQNHPPLFYTFIYIDTPHATRK